MNIPLSMEQLDKDSLFNFLASCPAANRYVLAISGGLDSSVLCHLFYQNKSRLQQQTELVYVDHKLQPESQSWGDFCSNLAERYGFDYTRLEVSDRPGPGDSIENWARTQRYALLHGRIQKNALLITAHHLDDQVETFFLQAFRGAGPRGLGGMQTMRSFAEGYLVRPLLSISRKQLEAYAVQHQLNWIEDPSNSDIDFDRNFLRNRLFPLIESRWSSYRKTIKRLIDHQSETRQILDDVAKQDLAAMLDQQQLSIDLEALKKLGSARQKNLILCWARQKQVATPNSRHLLQILTDVVESKTDSNPCVNWADVEIRRYRNRLYLLNKRLPEISDEICQWPNIQSELSIGDETLQASPVTGVGIAAAHLQGKPVTVRFRQGGERIRPANQFMTKTVKQLYQESGVLPWCRERFPLIYIDDRLAAIPGICIDEQFAAATDAPAFVIKWSGFSRSIEAHE